MKKYDKVFVPVNPETDGVSFDDNYHVSWEGFAGPSKDVPPVEVLPKTNVIVMTPDELRELWDHCANCQIDKETVYANAVNFQSYLQSKGITL